MEVFRGLAGVAAGDRKIDSRNEIAVEKRPSYGATQLFHWGSYAFGAEIRRIAARPKRLRPELALCLQVERKLLNVPNTSKMMRGASGVGSAESRSRASAFEKLASSVPN
jgi:hypothetical protein